MPRFITKKWIEGHDQLGNAEQIRFITPMLRLDLFDYSDAYIAIKEKVTVAGTSNSSKKKMGL